METQEIDLTKLTHLESKVNALLELEKITISDLEGLEKDERRHLANEATTILAGLSGLERDNFINKIELIIPPATKSDIRELNHGIITATLSKLIQEYGRMPTKTELANETCLSRQTVAKHLKEYKAQPEYVEEMEQFQLLAPKLLAKIFKFAVNGDIKAARLYLEMVGAINKKQVNTVVNEHTNYIQINNTILSQENLKRLSTEQLSQIENVITRVLPEQQKLKLI